MNKQLCRFTLFLLVCFSVLSTAAAQVEISAVPSATSPAVGYQIEVSINITGGSNVAGYDFVLTFNSTELEFISIENSDYFPENPYVVEPIVGEGSVRFAAVAIGGTGEGDGTLAVAKFKVLTETETRIGLEDVVIGDRAAQPMELAPTQGTTITSTAAGADVEYTLLIPRDLNLIHVPLKVTVVNDVAKTIEFVSDLYDALGGASKVLFLATYDLQNQTFSGYFGPSDKGTALDKKLTDDTGILANMIASTEVRLRGTPLGTNGTSTITLTPGFNVVGLPLRDSRITRVSDLLDLDGISGNVQGIILTDGGDFQLVTQPVDPSNIPIVGGQAFMLYAQQAETVTISGEGWANVSGVNAAPPVTLKGIEVRDTTPVLGLKGLIIGEGAGLTTGGLQVTVKNLSTGKAATTVTGHDETGYRHIIVDIETGRAAAIGDILEISAQSSHPLISVEPLEYTVTVEDVRQSWIQLPALLAYEIPAETALLHNYPNPFNPETWIPYQLAHAADVTLTIYDTKGVLVRQLDLGHQQAGYYTDRTRAAYWDGRNHLGESVGSGVYFYHLRAGDYSAIQKMVIVK